MVVFGGPLPLTRLAELEQVSPPAMTKTVAALEAAGLVSRERDGADRRLVRVTATPAGRAVLERGRAARVRIVRDLIDDLPEADRHTSDGPPN